MKLQFSQTDDPFGALHMTIFQSFTPDVIYCETSNWLGSCSASSDNFIKLCSKNLACDCLGCFLLKTYNNCRKKGLT